MCSAAVPKSKHVHTRYTQPTQVQPPFQQSKKPTHRPPQVGLSIKKKKKKKQKTALIFRIMQQDCSWKINPSASEKGHFSCSPRTPGEGAPMPWEVLCSATTTQARGQEQSAAELANCSLAEINSARHFCGLC